jgi:hypothetical protein
MRNMLWKKELVESKNSINIFKLKKQGFFDYPRRERTFWVDDLKMRLTHDAISQDWYINIENYGPTCRQSAINLGQTACHFGNNREWFICPRCEKRAGVLYQKNDDFSCRKCLDLAYTVSYMNYRSLQPWVRDKLKYDDIDFFSFRRHTYKGKLTKRYARYEKLREKMMAIGMYGAGF